MTRSVESLRIKASQPVEVLLRVDEDDEPPPDVWDQLIVGPRVGYGRMHDMCNDLAEVASGEWLMLWNDDALMLTECWDDVVYEHDRDVILNPATNHGPSLTPFPVVPRWMAVRLGHFALNRHCDSWWEEIGRALRILTPVPVEILHDRADMTGRNSDQTYRDRSYDPDFYGRANMDLIAADVEVLRRLL